MTSAPTFHMLLNQALRQLGQAKTDHATAQRLYLAELSPREAAEILAAKAAA